MKKLNVLSIDFDYFQNITKHVLLHEYPDGIDQPTEIASIIWASHYANPISGKAILQVTPRKHDLQDIKRIIRSSSQRHTPDSVIVNSHQYAYDFVIDHIENNPEFTHVNLVNIDTHHDLFNNNYTLDCGNWIDHLKQKLENQERQLQVTWITNPISTDIYGLTIEDFDGKITTGFECIQDTTWDLIFLCRSDIWTPPHLDNEFVKLAHVIMNHSVSCDYEDTVMTSRYTNEFIENYKNIQNQLYAAKAYANK